MKYLITGANGFLGKHLCKYLETHSINYLATVRSHPSTNQIGTGDLTTYTDWPALFKNTDVVIHAAAKAHEMSKNQDHKKELKKTYTKVNLELTKTLAIAAKANHVKRFIFISTIKVNGEYTDKKPFKADDVANPADDYSLSKYMAEQELLKLHESGVFEVVIIRPCLIYGPGVKANFEKLVKLVKKQIPLPFGAIHNKRSFLSVDNLTDLIICCATSPAAAGQIFLASDDNDISLRELIKIISNALNIKTVLIPIPAVLMKFAFILFGKSDFSKRLLKNLQADISKSKKLLNWKPPYTTHQSITKMLAWNEK